MYYSAIGLLAVLILLIENQDVILNQEGAFEKPAWRVYRRFLFAVLAYYILDIFWGVVGSMKLPNLLFANTTFYFIAMAVGVLFWVEYTVVYLDEESGFGKSLVLAGRVLAGFITVFAVVNIFTPVLFTIDGQCVYRALPLRSVLLACQILLLLLIAVYAVVSMFRSHAEKRGKYRTLGLFGLLMAVLLFIQIWYPLLPLYTIAYMLGTCLLHTFVVNEEKAEFKRGLEEAAKDKQLKSTIESLLNNLPGMTFTKDAGTGGYLACNRAFAEAAGQKTPEAVIGRTDAELFDEETARHFADDQRVAMSMDEPYIFYEDAVDENGRRLQVQTTLIKYKDDAGRLCLLGISQDVTDMVRIQRESATTKEAYEKARSTGLMYSHIAQSMTRGYRDMYYVNVDSEEFIEYSTDEAGGALTELRRGWHFFEECQIEAEQYVYADDRAAFIKALDRKTLMDMLDRNKTFVMTYRLIAEDGPIYVSMRVSRMEDDERYIVIGVTDVDEQAKQRLAEERMKEERTAYTRLSALAGDYLCIYVVDPETGHYREFSSSARFESFAQTKEGGDFYHTVLETARVYCHPEDLNRFFSAFSRENILSEIARRGIFTLSYRIMIEGEPRYVALKAAMVEEKEGKHLIVGLNDIDAQVHQEEEYVRSLAKARREANTDALTGVKNRHAYLEAEDRLNLQIAENRAPAFAVSILDVNDLKKVNDTEGHDAGDRFLRDACMIVCNIFSHSPVFRIGGDEFAVISQGGDYACIDELIGRVGEHNREAMHSGGIVIACGTAKYDNDGSVASVFERADQNMYENKSMLKAQKGGI